MMDVKDVSDEFKRLQTKFKGNKKQYITPPMFFILINHLIEKINENKEIEGKNLQSVVDYIIGRLDDQNDAIKQIENELKVALDEIEKLRSNINTTYKE